MIEQNTPEWLQQRLGHVTASGVADVMAKGKAGESLTRAKYKIRLVTERMTGQIQESFTNAAIEWGKEQEPYAAAAYEAKYGVLTDTIGFCKHPTIEWLGASPDRLVGDDGLIEIKCPNSQTMVQYILDGRVPGDYYKQIQCQLWVTDRQWCDFVAYDPRLNKRNQLLVIPVERDIEMISLMEQEVVKFLSEVEALINQLEQQ